MILTYTSLLHNIYHHLLTASLGTVFWQHRETILNLFQTGACVPFVSIAYRLRRFSRHLASASRIGTRSPRADSTAMGSDSVENIAVSPFRSPLFCSFQVHWQSARTPISIACLYTFYQSGEEWMEQVPSKYLLCSAFHFHLQVIRHHKAS